MSATWPEFFEPAVWSRKRGDFGGDVEIASLDRLADVLAARVGVARFELKFDGSASSIPRATLSVKAELTLTCQRTLEDYVEVIDRTSQLGFVDSETQLDSVGEDVEGWVMQEGGVRTRDLVEEELILAVPLVPISGDAPRGDWVHETQPADVEEEQEPSPFAALAQLKEKPTGRE